MSEAMELCNILSDVIFGPRSHRLKESSRPLQLGERVKVVYISLICYPIWFLPFGPKAVPVLIASPSPARSVESGAMVGV